ncbi:hypothetical protein CpecF_0785 [Chlamydia pecorum DBDeUG]|nr:hypothetical protein CpecF_0785 [Chlamydia pecorum DBDeUG]
MYYSCIHSLVETSCIGPIIKAPFISVVLSKLFNIYFNKPRRLVFYNSIE